MITKEKIIIREAYLKEIRPYYFNDYIKVITGVRRCGKSMMLQQIIDEISKNPNVSKDQILFINLESPLYMKINNGDKLLKVINKFIKNKDQNRILYLFIDEIQHIKRFEEVIAAIRVGYKCSLFVTGSNSKLLHGKLQDRLTGRAKEFNILPFTYYESLLYKEANNISIGQNDFDEFIKWGGMPQRFLELNEKNVISYYDSLFNSIIKKDIYQNHKRINKLRFEKISKYILSQSGKIFSCLSLAKQIKQELNIKNEKPLSKVINQFADFLIESYLIQECFPYDVASKKQVNGLRKFYPIDVGFKSANRNNVIPNKSFALEAVVFNELIYQGYKVSYGRCRNNEIDFVVTQNNKKCFIQIAYLLNSDETANREYKALHSIKSDCPKYVLSLDRDISSLDGIEHINVIDFLTHKVKIELK